VATFGHLPSPTHVAVDSTRHLIAYATDFSGRSDVYVRSLDEPEPTVRVSSEAFAMEPHWSANGTRLYFASGLGVEAVDVSIAPLRVSQGRSVQGVTNKAPPSGATQTFAVLPDGRIVYIKEGDTEPKDRLFIRQDWRSLLPEADAAPR
jgi:hypothetical protein